MEASAVIAALEPFRAEIAGLGVKRLLLVGSTAKGEAQADSDVDFVVEFEGAATFLAYMGLVELLEKAIGCAIDLTTLKALRPEIAPEVLAGAQQVA